MPPWTNISQQPWTVYEMSYNRICNFGHIAQPYHIIKLLLCNIIILSLSAVKVTFGEWRNIPASFHQHRRPLLLLLAYLQGNSTHPWRIKSNIILLNYDITKSRKKIQLFYCKKSKSLRFIWNTCPCFFLSVRTVYVRSACSLLTVGQTLKLNYSFVTRALTKLHVLQPPC